MKNEDIPRLYRSLNDLEQEFESEREGSKKENEGYCQWSVLPNGVYAPAQSTIKKLAAGLYEIKYNNSIGTYTMIQQTINADELFFLPSEEIDGVIDDVKRFWNSIDVFKTYKFAHKRGILLYGEPGCGKSCIIQLCMKHIVEEMDGIVINIKNEDDVENYISFIANFRQVEPNRPLIVIMEDIDSILGEDKYSTSRVLNVLDGIKQIENVVYIATTNYPEKLEERVTNRPSRFDRRYKVELPNSEMREAYFKHKIPTEDLIKINIETWVDDTHGMSLAHLREVVISTIVLGNTYDDTMSRLKSLKKAPRVKGSSSIGFGSV